MNSKTYNSELTCRGTERKVFYTTNSSLKNPGDEARKQAIKDFNEDRRLNQLRERELDESIRLSYIN